MDLKNGSDPRAYKAWLNSPSSIETQHKSSSSLQNLHYFCESQTIDQNPPSTLVSNAQGRRSHSFTRQPLTNITHSSQVNVKPLNGLKILASALAVVTAAPAPTEINGITTAPISARDQNAAQCRRACDRGADAVERFCRLIPEPRIRAACWGAAAAVKTPIGLRACTAFCDAFF